MRLIPVGIVVLAALAAAAGGAPVEHVVCPEGIYHVKPFTLAIGDKTLEASVEPLPDSVIITAKTVGWTYMRGWARYHRDTHELEWNAEDELSYLQAIGHPGPQPRQWYSGKTICVAKT